MKPVYITHHGELYSIRKIPDPPSKLQDTVNRAKAVVTYFKNLAFGNPKHRIKSRLLFDPDSGRKLSHNYQSKYGEKGEKLVDLLGSGPSRDELIQKGVIDYK